LSNKGAADNAASPPQVGRLCDAALLLRGSVVENAPEVRELEVGNAAPCLRTGPSERFTRSKGDLVVQKSLITDCNIYQ